jgi:Kef-type K+ transport system membrane component KefB
MFFFALGAMLNLGEIVVILPYAVGIAVLYILLKPPVINILLRLRAGQRPLAKEASIRLGQWSEFSLIIAALALELGQINQREWNIITVSCLLTMVISTYIVVLKYPTPLGVTGKLKQN